MEYKYNFSFIIPHKNLPDLLIRCVSSIPKRDDVQIIIVDDNSDPTIVDFENFPFNEEKNIDIIFDKSGKRQGHARNIGIDKAEGKWLIFADSDDFFFYSINRALNENVDNDADIVYFKATLLDNNTYLPCDNQNCVPNESVEKYLKGDKDGEHFVRFRYPTPWGKFFKSSLVREHSIRFAEIERLEDAQFSYQCGYYANKIDVKIYSIYCYVKRDNTVTTQITKESVYGIVKVCTDCLCFLEEKGLAKTPTYKIMIDFIFDNITNMKRENNEYFNISLGYLKNAGLSDKFINDNIRRVEKRRLRSSIFKLLLLKKR